MVGVLLQPGKGSGKDAKSQHLGKNAAQMGCDMVDMCGHDMT